ncbi:phosphate acetyltransferase [Alcaligenes sp. WGS1538]|uniref:phosphate acetyltransferase n=1 Tax=Alcaligenes sp. WGS1538 TaxID=3366811 RepID=UPI00372D6E55
MKLIEHLIAAAQARPRRIVLCEADDERILRAACQASRDAVAHITLVGDPRRIAARFVELGLDPGDVRIEDPCNSPNRPALLAALLERRKDKGLTDEQAQRWLDEPLCYANMMVHAGLADGSVAGAVHSTADVVRTALQLIGKAPHARLVSSFFIMMLCKQDHPRKGGLIFSDCGLVIDPDAEQLCDIALAAADSAQLLLNETPRVAMLSFSTAGSAQHERVSKVVQAARQIKARRPDLAIDEDVQLDAALIEEVAARKLPGSAVAGKANVLIFPNLEAGNIGYKMAERLGGAIAIGPLLQGLSKPANDLSRGCSTQDIYNVIAVTGVQCLQETAARN